MNKILILIVLCVLLTSCAGMGGNKGDTEPTTFSPTGTEGVTIGFVSNQPPATIYTGSPLDVSIEVRNEGTFTTVQPIDLYISGYDDAILQISNPHEAVDSMEGRSQFNSIGDFDTIVFSAGNVGLQQGVNEYRPTLLVSACYLYQTIATPIVCVDPQPTNQYMDRSCMPGSISTGSQGAPVAVQSIDQETTPSSILFKVNIANVGGGVVYNEDRRSLCPAGLTYKEFDLVNYDIHLAQDRLSGECKPASPVRLVNGRATIFCKFSQDTQATTTYETPLNIQLNYGYKEVISKQITVKNIDE